MNTKKKSLILAIATMLVLTGCDTKSSDNKPKAYVPYSNLIPESSSAKSISSSQSISTNNSIKNESSSLTESVAEYSPAENSLTDYSEIENNTPDINIPDNPTKNSNSVPSSSFSSSAEPQQPDDDYTATVKYTDNPQQSSSANSSPTMSTITSTKQDNSLAIEKIKHQITVCENEIQSYEIEIDRLNDAVKSAKRTQDDLKNGELIEARKDLENAKKRKVWVYSEGGGFQQVQDESAVKKAQERVEYYENLISDYDDIIAKGEGNIKKCELEISSLKSQIAVYRAEIRELSQ